MEKLLEKLRKQQEAEWNNLVVNKAEFEEVDVMDVGHCAMLKKLISKGEGRIEVLNSVIFDLMVEQVERRNQRIKYPRKCTKVMQSTSKSTRTTKCVNDK